MSVPKRGEPDEFCPHCHQKIPKLNPHKIDRAKLERLDLTARLHTQGYPWVRATRDGTTVKPEEAAFTIVGEDAHSLRLSWFGLLQKRGKREGWYRVTPLGYGFLAGRATVPVTIHCLKGKVYRVSAEQVSVHQVKDVILDKAYWDNYAQVQGYI